MGRLVAVVLAGAVLAGCGGGSGADTSLDPARTTAAPTPAPTLAPTASTGDPTPMPSTGTAPTETAPAATPPTVDVPTDEGRPLGFGTIGAIVTAPSGETCELCLWLAADPDARARGLMGVTDLAGAEGMAFRYDEPRTTAFTMRNTLLPLSIAFFDADGRFLDAFDMEPCQEEPCPSYPTPTGFSVAVEVPAGALPELGIGPGATLQTLAEGCDPAALRRPTEG